MNPVLRMASSTLPLSAALTESGRLMVLETVAIDTFARRATSSIVMEGADLSDAIFAVGPNLTEDNQNYNDFVSAFNQLIKRIFL
jgi:hypothetical protein